MWVFGDYKAMTMYIFTVNGNYMAERDVVQLERS